MGHSKNEAFEIRIAKDLEACQKSVDILASGLDEIKGLTQKESDTWRSQLDTISQKLHRMEIDLQHVAKRSEMETVQESLNKAVHRIRDAEQSLKSEFGLGDGELNKQIKALETKIEKNQSENQKRFSAIENSHSKQSGKLEWLWVIIGATVATLIQMFIKGK